MLVCLPLPFKKFILKSLICFDSLYIWSWDWIWPLFINVEQLARWSHLILAFKIMIRTSQYHFKFLHTYHFHFLDVRKWKTLFYLIFYQRLTHILIRVSTVPKSRQFFFLLIPETHCYFVRNSLNKLLQPSYMIVNWLIILFLDLS